MFRALAFVFIHLKRGGKTCKDDYRAISPIVWDIDAFRAEIMEFRNGLTDEDEADAMRIMDECIARDKKTEVSAGPIGGKDETASQKKIEEPSQVH